MSLLLSRREVADIVYEANRRNLPWDAVIRERQMRWRKRFARPFVDRDSLALVTTDNIKYATSTALTITLNSLATSATVGRQATVIDNGTNLYDDALVTVIISTSASAIGSTKSVQTYLSASEDGTNYDQDDGAMGASDAGYTINSPTNLKLAMSMNTPTSSKVYNRTFSILTVNGQMPRKWTIVVCNDTNQSLLSSGNSASYSGVTFTNS